MFLPRSSVFKNCGDSERNSLSESSESWLSARKSEPGAEHSNTAGRAGVSPVPQPPSEASKAGPVRVMRTRHSPASTRQDHGDKASLRSGWKSAAVQGLCPEQ